MFKPISILILASFCFFVACKDDNDKDCVPPEVSENIIGSWSLHTGGEVEFESDGTLLDPNGSLIAAGVNGVLYDQKSYEIFSSGDSIMLHASPPSLQDSVTFRWGIAMNLCDTIWVSSGGFAVVMSRIE